MPSPRRSPTPLLQETREHWPLMNYYERFEHVVAFILSLIIAVVIALAMLQLLARVVPVLLSGAIDPLDHEVFQGLFGMIMTLLIALEFKHSIIRVALRRDYPGTTVQLFSSLKRAGLEDAAGVMGKAVDAFRPQKTRAPAKGE